MNKNILFLIDHQLNPEKYTQEQLEANRDDSYAEFNDAAAAGYNANAAIYDAASDACDVAAIANIDAAAHWIDRYFIQSDESKQDYVDVINKDKQVMNKHILMVIDHQMNPDKYTQEQLQENYKAAFGVAAADKAAFGVDAYPAAYLATNDSDVKAAWAACDVADAAANDSDAPYWLNKYFEITGENKQDYIDKLEAQS